MPLEDDDRPTGRARGARHGAAKLTDDEVAKLRRLHETGTWSVRQLAREFRCSKSQVQRIIARENRTDRLPMWP